MRSKTEKSFIMDHSTLLFSCLFLLLSTLSLILFSRRRHGAACKLPPGPIKLPLVGNLHQLGNLPHRSLSELSQKYGPLMYLKLGSIPTIVTSSADTAREFLKIHDHECCNRPFGTSLEKHSYGFCDIAFVPYGEQWKELRKICNLHIFSTKKVASFRCVREDEFERMVNYISMRCDSEINLTEELLLRANNITCRSVLGKACYSGGTSDGWRLHEILKEAQTLFTGFFFADFMPELGWLDALTGKRGRLEKNFRDLDDIYQKVIDDHLDPARKDDRDTDVVDTLLDMRKTTSHITDNHVKGILMNIFIGGSESSVATILWAMSELMRSPEAMKKAQDEIRYLLGNKGKVDETDLDDLLYMKSVVKETMRLHIPGPLIQRETMQHCKVNGYDIPAKTRLFINAWAIARDPDIWEKPDEFDPERFMNSDIDFAGHDFQFIPFGAGRRMCPGMQSGILVVMLGLASLLYHFDWELPEGMSKEDIDMSEAPGITVARKSTLRLVPKKYRRNADEI